MDNDRQELIGILQQLTKDGLICYLNKDEDYCYGYIVTPSDNLMYIEQSPYRNGWNFSLSYVPSKDNGSGWRCPIDPAVNVTKEVVLLAEKAGIDLANKLHAILYKSSEQYLSENMYRLTRI